MTYLDLTFGDDWSLTIWIPIAEDEQREFNVATSLTPYEVIELTRLTGKTVTIRIIDDNGMPVVLR